MSPKPAAAKRTAVKPTHFAIVFREDRLKGSDPDPQQDWKKGELYSVGTTVDRSTLPDYFECIGLARAPEEHEIWSPTARKFVPRTPDIDVPAQPAAAAEQPARAKRSKK